MMGLPDGRKSFDTIPAVTDSQPATQPPSQTRCRSKDTAYYVAMYIFFRLISWSTPLHISLSDASWTAFGSEPACDVVNSSTRSIAVHHSHHQSLDIHPAECRCARTVVTSSALPRRLPCNVCVLYSLTVLFLTMSFQHTSCIRL